MDVKAMSDLELARVCFYIYMSDYWTQSDKDKLALVGAEMQLRGIRASDFTTEELAGVK